MLQKIAGIMAWAKGFTPLKVVSIILFVRILSVFLVQTWYVPDEYWQTLEVAHKYAFGYGVLTWEWQRGIRSYLYPSIFMVLFYILKATGLDYPEAVIFAPRILQAIISTVSDYYFYKWTGHKWALYLMITSWFMFYTSSRTLLQTAETALVTIALSMYPFQRTKFLGQYHKENIKWIWVACICVFMRPTSAPLWMVLVVYDFLTTNQDRLKLFIQTYVPIVLICGGALVALDSCFHGSFIVTPWEFFRFNILHDIASFYGRHPWYWYLLQGLPAILGVNLLPVIIAVNRIVRNPKQNNIEFLLLIAAFLHIALHSAIPHKEFRFMMPLMPMFLYLAQNVIVMWSRKAKKFQLYLVIGIILWANAIPAAYFSLIHQSGTLKVMPVLREAIPNNQTSVLFLMPCHSTPLYSHLHTNVSTRYLACDPPIDNPDRTYEAEAFYNNPYSWWLKEYSTRQKPNLIVMFDVLKGRVRNVLSEYTELVELHHTQFPEGEVGEKVIVYQKVDNKPKKIQPDEAV